MFNSVVLILFIASVHCQDSEPCASCNVQPIINYNFGTTITLPSSVVVDGQINNSQVTEGQINPSEVIGSLCQKNDEELSTETRNELRQLQAQIDELMSESNEIAEERRQIVALIDELRVESNDLQSQLLQQYAAMKPSREEQCSSICGAKKILQKRICNGFLNLSTDNFTEQSLLRGYVELEDGWIAPLNGYQYKAINTSQTWEESRDICQSLGGDLIADGFRDHSARVTITQAFDLDNFYWIGLTSITGEWTWVNGFGIRTDDTSLFWPGRPNTGDYEPGGPRFCARSRFASEGSGSYVYLIDDTFCSSTYETICEKRV